MGTLSLVFTCAITLFLCVWTTVQVNIEPPENEFNPTLARFIPIKALKHNETLLKFLAKRSIRKLGWSFVTLIMPEGVMAIAAYERKTASILRKEVNKVIPKESDQWDMFLAYYAIMGGFVIPKHDYDSVSSQLNSQIEGEMKLHPRQDQELTVDPKLTTPELLPALASKQGFDTIDPVNSDKEKAISNDGGGDYDLQNRLLTLTPYGVLQLVKWQSGQSGKQTARLITITSSQVQDKSNASSLTKLIVAWQALWMIVQVIGRRAETPDIPITLLELHTCLHAFCAFAMYLTWWNKPVDIDLPTTVHLTPRADCLP
ncbi:uncharacterized protein N0V89_001678 [Didymosphaeria variabile]|uniref:Uncharacterized protein n=1 Tax=Didymosphaeria variabile TaxID=1932322 RepID=A0A9W8XZU3_9PLEO|nr:uncharacterized protein N0V89_001678 [Didymosphaeria variabile]KAJ4361109.1 hypothetical protein N0V89_001678 [Didymosphaeria variabile]